MHFLKRTYEVPDDFSASTDRNRDSCVTHEKPGTRSLQADYRDGCRHCFRNHEPLCLPTRVQEYACVGIVLSKLGLGQPVDNRHMIANAELANAVFHLRQHGTRSDDRQVDVITRSGGVKKGFKCVDRRQEPLERYESADGQDVEVGSPSWLTLEHGVSSSIGLKAHPAIDAFVWARHVVVRVQDDRRAANGTAQEWVEPPEEPLQYCSAPFIEDSPAGQFRVE